MYANDTSFLFSLKIHMRTHERIDHLNTEKNKIIRWLFANPLNINESKTYFILFRRSNKLFHTAVTQVCNTNASIMRAYLLKFMGFVSLKKYKKKSNNE